MNKGPTVKKALNMNINVNMNSPAAVDLKSTSTYSCFFYNKHAYKKHEVEIRQKLRNI